MAKRKKKSAAKRHAARQAQTKIEAAKVSGIPENAEEAKAEEAGAEGAKTEEVSKGKAEPEEVAAGEKSEENAAPEEIKAEENVEVKAETEEIATEEKLEEKAEPEEVKAEEVSEEKSESKEADEVESKPIADAEQVEEPNWTADAESEGELGSVEESEPEDEEERRRRLRRQERIERMKREKRRIELIQKCVIPVAAVVIILIVGGVFFASRSGAEDETHYDSVLHGVQMPSLVQNQEPVPTAVPGGPMQQGNAEISNTSVQDGDTIPENTPVPTEEPEVYGPYLSDRPKPPVFEAVTTEDTVGFPATLQSEYGVMIDVEEGVILAEKDGMVRMSPASMTKILTVLVAAEELGLTAENWEENPVLDDTFTITIEITDYSYSNDCSCVGFDVGEIVTVRDLFYGTILPSGADAALALALYVSGTHEEFVECMNEKLEEMELSDTSHFTNCVGLYGKEHYSTAYDMAVILKTATENPFCREVLSAKKYNTSPNATHQEGLLISNWFLRRIEDRDTNGEVLCAKTGYVDESRSCAASLAVDSAGKEYLCVTAGAGNSWRCIDDQVALYQRHLPEPQTE